MEKLEFVKALGEKIIKDQHDYFAVAKWSCSLLMIFSPSAFANSDFSMMPYSYFP
jgi:hypothetical protein